MQEKEKLVLNSQEINQRFACGEELNNVSFVGKLVHIRIQGKSSFASLRDNEGIVQINVQRDDICPGKDKSLYNSFFKEQLQVGDIIEVGGHVFKTQQGETTINVLEIQRSSEQFLFM